MVAKPLCPLYKYIIKPLDRAYYPELRYYRKNNHSNQSEQKKSRKIGDVSIFLFIFAVVNHLLLIRLRKNLFARRTYIDRDFQYYNFNKKKKHDEKIYF